MLSSPPEFSTTTTCSAHHGRTSAHGAGVELVWGAELAPSQRLSRRRTARARWHDLWGGWHQQQQQRGEAPSSDFARHRPQACGTAHEASLPLVGNRLFRLTGRSVFNLSVSGRPRGSEPVGRQETQKTKNRGPEGGPGPQGPSGLGPRWVGRVGGRWVGGPVGWSTGQVGRVDQWGGRGGWGWLYCCLGGQNA